MTHIHITFSRAIEISDLYSELFVFIGRQQIHHGFLLDLKNSLEKCNEAKKELREVQNNLIYQLELNLNADRRKQQLNYIETAYIPRLETYYPPKQHTIYESQEILHLLHNKLQDDKQPDSEMARFLMHQMDATKFQMDIPGDKNMILKDASTGEIIGLVLRRFVSINRVVDWVDSVVVEGCTIKQTAQVSMKPLDYLYLQLLTGFDVV